MGKIKLVLACFLAYSCLSNLNATNYYVNDASTTGDVYCTAIGSNANSGLTKSLPKLTLANVLSTYSASFASGDTIFVDAGSYTDNSLSSPKNGVVIIGVYSKSFFTNGGGDNYFMAIKNNNTVLENLTLSNYNAQTCSINGQVIGVANGVTGVKIINTIVQKTSVSSSACGYPIDIGTSASVSFSGGGSNCNNWDAGGGIHISNSATVTINNYLFYGNYDMFTNGCALKVDGGLVNVRNSTFINNWSDGDNYGAALFMSGGIVNMYDCYIDSNFTGLNNDAPGGSILVSGGSFYITRSIIKNHKQTAGSTSEGSGVAVTGGTAIIDSTLFLNNSGKTSYGTDVYNSGGSTIVARNCTFGSAAGQIGSGTANSFSITNCGNPSVGTGTIKKIDTNAPTYTASPSVPWFSGSCPTNVTIIPTCTATPSITSSAPTTTLCSGGTYSTNLTASTGSAQTTYNWTSTLVVGITGHSSNGAGNINETLTNTTTNSLTVTYSVTPIYNTTCKGSVVVYSVTVLPKSAISVTSATLCAGNTATITPTGANTYTIQPLNISGSTFTISPGSSSSYTVSGNSSNGCIAQTATFSITINTLPTITLTATSSSICIGNSATLTATGASSYTWSPSTTLSSAGGSSVTATPTTAITYTVNAIDNNNCVNSNTLTLNVNPLPTILISRPATICIGGSTTITATGANSYKWTEPTGGGLTSTTGGTVVATPVATGTLTYSVTATDLNNCTNTATGLINVNSLPALTISPSPSGTACAGSVASLTITGADTYSWSTGAFTNTVNITGVNSGTTTLTNTISVVGTNTTTNCSNTDTYTLTVSPTPTISLASPSYSICSGSSTSFSVSGNTNSYVWTVPNGASINSGSTSATPNVTGTNTTSLATSVVFTVTGTAGTCTSNPQTVTLTINPTPTLNVVNSSSTTICAGSTFTLSATGASSYTWSSTSGGGLSSVTGSSVAVNPAISSGTLTYSTTGISALGCTAMTTSSLSVNPTPNYTVSGNPYAICSGGSQVIGVSGVTTCTWTPTTNLVGANSLNPTVNPTVTTTYSVTGDNAFGCSNPTPAIVTVIVTPTPTLSLAGGNTYSICVGSSVTFSVEPSLNSYTWTSNSNGTLSSTNIENPTANPTVTTTYTVSGTAGGCAASTPITATVYVNSLPTILISRPATICIGGSTTITATGANTYAWTQPTGGGLNSTTSGTVIATPVTTGTLTYSVTATDVNSCTNTATGLITVNALPSLTLTASSQTICAGGSSTLTAVGANTYSWSPLGSYSSLTDTSIVSTTSLTTNYTVTATDINNCTNIQNITLHVNPLPSLTVAASSSTVCAGSTLTLTATGANTYTWSPLGNLSPLTDSSVVSTITNTTTYTVNATDNNSCASTQTITINTNPLPTLTLSASSTTVCSGNTSTLTVVGATSYTWSPSSVLNSSIGSSVFANPTDTTYFLANAIDNNGCTYKDSILIAVNPTPTVSIVSVGGGNTQTVCAGQNVNTISFNNSNGSVPNWSNNNISIGIAATGTTNILSYVAPLVNSQQSGTITAIAVDTTTGCKSSNINPPAYIVTINPLPVINATDSLTPAGCGGLANGCINNVSGQLPGTYQYSWDNGVTWSSNSQNCNIPAGNYTVEVQDINSCITQKTITLPTANAPSNPSISGNPTNACAGDTIHLSITTPQPKATYTWSTSAGIQTGTSLTINNITQVGNYTIQITTTDSNACSNSTSLNFTVNATPQPIISGNTHFCKGTSTVLSVAPINSSYAYQWNSMGILIGGTTSSTYTATSGGIYGVSVSNTLTGCKHDTLITITVDSVPSAPSVVSTTNNNTYCQGSIINPIALTGTGNFIWYSDPLLTAQIGTGSPFTPSVTATSTVYVTASNSLCTSDSTPVVIVINPTPPTPTVNVTGNSIVRCQGVPVGTITATGSSTIVWYSNAGLTMVVDTGNTFAPVGLPIGTTTYYLIDSSAAGCKSVGTASVSVTIHQKPNAPILSGLNTPYCGTLSINPISATTTPVGDTVVWYSGGVYQSNQNPFTPIILTPGTYTYVAFDSSATGCVSAQSAQTVTITVNAIPGTPTITTTPIDTICKGDVIPTFSVNGSSGNTLVWYNNAALTPPYVTTGNAYTPSNLAVGSYTYYVTDVSAAGCSSAIPTSVTVTVYPKPVIAGTGNVTNTTCGNNNGSVVGLNIVPNSGTPNYTYQWVNNNGAIVGNSLNLNNAAAGTYSLIVIDHHNCKDTSSGSGFVVQGSTPVTAGFISSTTEGNAPLAVSFSNTSIGATHFTWNFGLNADSSNQVSPSFTYTASGTYTVMLSASNGSCNSNFPLTISVVISQELIIPNIFSPNGDGINDQFFITGSDINTLHCDIFNRWGELVFSLKSPSQTWDGVMNNGNKATEGTYFYILQAGNINGIEYKRNGTLTLVR